MDVCQDIFDTLHVFYYPADNTVDIQEKQYIFQYEFRVVDEAAGVQPQDVNIDMFFIPANDSSTIRKTGKIEYPRHLDSMTSMFTTSRNTYNEITIQPAQTKILRPGFMGLFGLFQDKSVVSFTWSMLSLKDNSTGSTITIKPPISLTERRQILVTSAQSAFAAAGGAFTLVSILFMVLMGRPRYNPFGLFQSSFQRLRTHRKLKDDYAILMTEPGKPATPTIWDMVARRRSRHDQDEAFLQHGQKRRFQSQTRRESQGFSAVSSGYHSNNSKGHQRDSETPFLTSMRSGGDDRYGHRALEQADSDHAMELISPESATTPPLSATAAAASGYSGGNSLDGHLLPRPSSNASGVSLDKETLRGSIQSQTPRDIRDMETILLIQRDRIAELEAQQEQTEQKLDDLIGVLREYYVDMMMFEPYDGDSIKTTIQRSFTRGAGPIKRSFGIGEQESQQQQQHQQQQQQQQHQRSHPWRRPSLHSTPKSHALDDTDESRIGLTAASAAPFGQATSESAPGSHPFPPYANTGSSGSSWHTPAYEAVPHQASYSQLPSQSQIPSHPRLGADNPSSSLSSPPQTQTQTHGQNPFMSQSECNIPLRTIHPDTFP
ncbi:hypothetical protein BGZ73_001086 [Actinomortierella ambigua]|nr:hypothetical protein BGZ73_001086 [Actinomortierella ambigua]